MNDQEANNNNANILLSQQFQTITNSSEDEACQYLEMSNYNLDMAVGLYMEVHGDGEVVVDGEGGEDADDDINVATVVDTYCESNADDDIDAPRNNCLEEPDYDHLEIIDDRDEEGGGGASCEAEEDDENEINTTFDTLCNQIISPSVDIATSVHSSEQKQAGDGASCNTEDSEEDEDIASLTSDSPNYDHLGLDCAELSASVFDEFASKKDSKSVQDDTLQLASNDHSKMEKIGEHENENEYNFYAAVEENKLLEDDGEEYILGTMMVRVLQARHVKVCFILVSHTVLCAHIILVCCIMLCSFLISTYAI